MSYRISWQGVTPEVVQPDEPDDSDWYRFYDTPQEAKAKELESINIDAQDLLQVINKHLNSIEKYRAQTLTLEKLEVG